MTEVVVESVAATSNSTYALTMMALRGIVILVNRIPTSCEVLLSCPSCRSGLVKSTLPLLIFSSASFAELLTCEVTVVNGIGVEVGDGVEEGVGE